MSRREAYKLICRVAEREYADIVQRAGFDDESARIYFIDESFLEVWLHTGENLMKRYAFHWERRHVNGKIFRHDNTLTFDGKGLKPFLNTFTMRSNQTPLKAAFLTTLYQPPNIF